MKYVLFFEITKTITTNIWSFKMKSLMTTFTLIGLIIIAIGCSQPLDRESGPTGASGNSAIPTGIQYIAATEPANAEPVGAARQTVKDGDAITLVGRIGGSAEPFVNGMAAFTIVDPGVAHCAPEEGCPTPWDYCCTQNEVKDNIATVKVVDDQEKPVGADARQLLAVKELSLVVVAGKAKRDEQGNLTVLAGKVFVRPDK